MSRRLEPFSLTLVALAVAMWRFGATTVDRDLWGHIRFGLDKLDSGGFISTDVYSYLTEGRTWFNHEWLSEVIMAAVYRWQGSAGLVILKALLALAVLGFLGYWLNRVGVSAVRSALLLLLSALVLAPTFGTFRPQLFTVLLFTGLLVLVQSIESGSLWPLLLVPPVFALWVNLHGGVLAGLAIYGTWAVIYAATENGRYRFLPLAAGALGAVALGANPNGFAHVGFLIRTTTVSRPEIQDWQPVDPASAVGVAFLLLLAVVGFALLRSRRQLRYPIVVPLIAVCIAPFLALRHLQLFAPAVIILAGSYVARLERPARQEPDPASKVSTASVALFTVVAVLASSFILVTTARATSCLKVDANQFEFPERAMAALTSAGLDGNSVVTFNWGEYVIWHAGSSNLVSIDGRRETIYSDEVLQANIDFMEAQGEWQRLLDMEPADVLLVPTAAPVFPLIENGADWDVVYTDPLASVLVPAGTTASVTGDETLPIDGNGSCFP